MWGNWLWFQLWLSRVDMSIKRKRKRKKVFCTEFSRWSMFKINFDSHYGSMHTLRLSHFSIGLKSYKNDLYMLVDKQWNRNYEQKTPDTEYIRSVCFNTSLNRGARQSLNTKRHHHCKQWAFEQNMRTRSIYTADS